MKLRDRISGLNVSFPETLHPWRFELINRESIYNGHTTLRKGDAIIPDGTTDNHLDELAFVFECKEIGPEEMARQELVLEAIKTIAGIINKHNSILPSPLLPQKMAELSELLPLESILRDIETKGHLHEITRAPRLDMNYQESITQVSRARRIAVSAQRHLASDTSSWQQRTLTGVIPKKILALFSVDDFTIYENRLFARLVDRLENHLVQRLAKVETILNNFLEAQKFDSSDHYHRVRQSICKIWGETFDEKQTSAQIDISEHAVETIEGLLRSIRSLKGSELYRSIPRSMRVPDQIHMTNILIHDQHYRHLVTLWEKQLEVSVDSKHSPEDQHKINCQTHDSYIAYVGIVLKRAVRQLGGDSSSDTYSLGIKQEGHEWKVSSKSGKPLVFIPIAYNATETFNPINNPKEMRIPVFLNGCYEGFDPIAYLNGKNNHYNFVFTPLDFLVEEKTVTLLKAWFWQNIFDTYGKVIHKIPSKVTQFLADIAEFEINGSNVSLLSPLPSHINENLWKILNKNANDNLREEFKVVISNLDLLDICQGCGKKNRFSARENKSFIAVCDLCGLENGVFTEKGVRKASIKVTGETDGSFDKFGRWCMDLNLWFLTRTCAK